MPKPSFSLCTYTLQYNSQPCIRTGQEVVLFMMAFSSNMIYSSCELLCVGFYVFLSSDGLVHVCDVFLPRS